MLFSMSGENKGVNELRFVALALTIAALGGVGLVFVGSAQAHGGAGGGAMDVLQQTCFTNPTQGTVVSDACTDLQENTQR
jgi:hypothetical protein